LEEYHRRGRKKPGTKKQAPVSLGTPLEVGRGMKGIWRLTEKGTRELNRVRGGKLRYAQGKTEAS